MKSAFAFAVALALGACASAPAPAPADTSLVTQEGKSCPDGQRYTICKTKEAWRLTKWRSEDSQARYDGSPLTISRDPSLPKYPTIGADGQPVG